MTGSTSSKNFAGANNTYHGDGDAFVAEVNSTGSLVGATYLGGANDDIGWGIAPDSAGNARVTGLTSSANFAGANNKYHGDDDAFVAEVRSF